MNEKTINNDEEFEIDLQRVFGALLKKAWLILAAAVACAAAALLVTVFLIKPKYQASAMFYVNNSSLSLGEAALSITSSDISASRGLVKSYIVILNTRESLNDVIDYAGADLTYAELKAMITAESVDSTEIFEVVVTSEDPAQAQALADAIAYILPKRIASIIEGTSAKVVDAAVLPSKPSSPSYTKNTMVGFAVGLAAAMAFIALRAILDGSIRTEEDLRQSCSYPILAAIPDMEGRSKGGSAYGYGARGLQTRTAAPTALVGGDVPFAAAEAYKLLRTKLLFSFAQEDGCRVVGVSSALTGEGKSLSAVNLAYAMSQLGKRVLLIDCDMRRPSLAEKLPVRGEPGLSDFLAGQIQADKLIQSCGIREEERAFHVIAAGKVPPNPMELLSSARMEKMMARLREAYDYILLDLPPVDEVGDALAVAKLTDGILLVVRQNGCDRAALSAAVRQFEFVNARLLGLVFNGTAEAAAPYGSRYYRSRYNKESAAYGRRTAAERQPGSKAGG